MQLLDFKEPFNPLVPGIQKKVTHTYTNLQLKGAALLKYVWSFNGHQTLKGQHAGSKYIFPESKNRQLHVQN